MALEEQSQAFQAAREEAEASKRAVQSFIVGQDAAIDQLFWSILAEGHVLLEGLPGMGKTMLVRTVADIMRLRFSRIQFTPDLMPSDITGTTMVQQSAEGKQSFSFHHGPIFSNIVLADEINRATPKTQSALLEAMAEKTVTVMGETNTLPAPFFVLATQNPIDLEGTYPLPEAQVDRFLCKVLMPYPSKEDLKEIVKRTVLQEHEPFTPLMEAEQLLEIQQMVKKVLVSDDVLDFAVQCILCTHHDEEKAPPLIRQYVRFGAGPRGLQGMLRLAKARAFMEGRYHVSKNDIIAVIKPVLRHRLFLNFEGEASGMSIDHLLDEVIDAVAEKGRVR
ncbi:AAA family ATPase [Aureibacillus halotolerans]|uniref:MoxR-like ATPase n=1 Tax=Aureibacillus halotolerans TaxID=1508390 RepID=A0A4R6U661_9BACI|nr:MoxR family ATPase [Aureibacillus halotolerans]TDQ40343.1 MoxR-like ATPase [Aureibacillus halotolerans]